MSQFNKCGPSGSSITMRKQRLNTSETRLISGNTVSITRTNGLVVSKVVLAASAHVCTFYNCLITCAIFCGLYWICKSGPGAALIICDHFFAASRICRSCTGRAVRFICTAQCFSTVLRAFEISISKVEGWISMISHRKELGQKSQAQKVRAFRFAPKE